MSCSLFSVETAQADFIRFFSFMIFAFTYRLDSIDNIIRIHFLIICIDQFC